MSLDGICEVQTYYGTEGPGHYWHQNLLYCIHCGQLWLDHNESWIKVNPGLMAKGTIETK